VVWQLSLDDGAGADSVTEYSILRRPGVSGPLTEVGRVPAETTEFMDSTVTDGVDYYYVVRATDGTLFSDTDAVGPVQSENDGAPPKVQGVYAEDRPADDGGAIRVGWNPYAAPPDFDHFSIYRAPVPFTSISLMQPIAQINDANATEHVDATTVDGVDYYYAVTAVDEFGNVVMSVTSVGPVQCFANGPMTIAAGMHFFGSPLEPGNRDPAGFFGVAPGALKMARWSRTDGRYVLYSGPSSLPLVLGHGYWLKLDSALSFTPAGNAAPSGSLSLNLGTGWHQLANPYFSEMDMTGATVRYLGTTMDLASSDAANIMRQTFWTYNAADNGYNLIAPFLGIGDSAIPAWKGFWARVEKACTVTLPRPGTLTVAGGAMVPAGEGSDGWVARLCVRSRGGCDRDNFFGVSDSLSRAQSLVSPPPTAGGVDLYFCEESGAGERLAGRFSPGGSGQVAWQMRVQGQPGEQIEVWCPDPGAIAPGYAATLSDPATGADVNVRNGRYRVALRGDETARPMLLRLTRTGGALTLTSVTAQPTRAGGAQVSFALSAAAQCTVQVLNIAGRTVRVLERDRQRPAGAAQVVWNGRSDSGSTVPRGVYLMQVEAAGADGSRTQAVRTLAIGR